MRYKLDLLSLPSRRGRYTLALLESNPIIWAPQPLTLNDSRHVAVAEEVLYAQQSRLAAHIYWQNEPLTWILAYEQFYTELFQMNWLYKNEDRHSLVVSKECCLTLVQYHNHRLIAYSRSTDMRNGYHSDKLLLDYLAERINLVRPDCEVKTIEWYLAIPHVYEEKGIARLKKDEETT